MQIELGSVLQALCYAIMMNWGSFWKRHVIIRNCYCNVTLLMIKILKLYLPEMCV
jgi:hypothetical protein